ncbi:MAG: hypothetical protein ACLUN0_04210 [Roseburia sp.]
MIEKFNFNRGAVSFALDYYTEKHRECGIESGAADRGSQVSVIKDRPSGVYREQYSLQ